MSDCIADCLLPVPNNVFYMKKKDVIVVTWTCCTFITLSCYIHILTVSTSNSVLWNLFTLTLWYTMGFPLESRRAHVTRLSQSTWLLPLIEYIFCHLHSYHICKISGGSWYVFLLPLQLCDLAVVRDSCRESQHGLAKYSSSKSVFVCVCVFFQSYTSCPLWSF